ncbi:MAG: pilus assembly protein [Acidimicrobiia bacterium]|nr:pilus assembly protein [Acidimicrobiia bacterium]
MPARVRGTESGAVTTEFTLLYGALLALVMSVIHFGLVFNAALAVTDAADVVLEAAQLAGGSDFSPRELARAVVGDDRLVRDLSVEVVRSAGDMVVTVSATAPRIVPGLPRAVSHRVRGPVERFIPEGRR